MASGCPSKNGGAAAICAGARRFSAHEETDLATRNCPAPPRRPPAPAHQDCTPPATIGGTRLFWQSVHRKTQCVAQSGRERTSRLVLPRRRGHLRCSPALGQQAVACGSFETRSTRADDAMDSGRTTTRINDDRNSMPIATVTNFWVQTPCHRSSALHASTSGEPANRTGRRPISRPATAPGPL